MNRIVLVICSIMWIYNIAWSQHPELPKPKLPGRVLSHSNPITIPKASSSTTGKNNNIQIQDKGMYYKTSSKKTTQSTDLFACSGVTESSIEPDSPKDLITAQDLEELQVRLGTIRLHKSSNN